MIRMAVTLAIMAGWASVRTISRHQAHGRGLRRDGSGERLLQDAGRQSAICIAVQVA
jgi:hypothetical protein